MKGMALTFPLPLFHRLSVHLSTLLPNPHTFLSPIFSAPSTFPPPVKHHPSHICSEKVPSCSSQLLSYSPSHSLRLPLNISVDNVFTTTITTATTTTTTINTINTTITTINTSLA